MSNHFFDNHHPAVWDPSPVMPNDFNRRRGGAKKRTHFVVIGALAALVVALAVVIVLLVLNHGTFPFLTSSSSSDEGSGFDNYFNYFNSESETKTAETTITQGPTTNQLTLTLSEPAKELTSQEIYQKVLPSIVSITAMNGDTGGQGTGIIISEDGYLITNDHVITGEATATVTLQDGSTHPATLVGSDGESDLAVLKIDATGLTPAEFGNSNLLQVGDSTFAVTNPLGEDFYGSMTEGIISSLHREVNSNGYHMSLIQHTAAINSGSSGGALVNVYGQIVGITNMKMASSYNSVEGIGFAIPTVQAKQVVDLLLANGAITGRPTIGITCYDLDADTASQKGVVAGIYVASVKDQSDAYKQGLKSGDVITAVNGVESPDMAQLTAMKDSLGIGGLINATVWRDGTTLTISFALVDQCDLD
jgi:serine protease Do